MVIFLNVSASICYLHSLKLNNGYGKSFSGLSKQKTNNNNNKKIFDCLVFSVTFTWEFTKLHGLTPCTQVMLIYYIMKYIY